MLSNLKFIAVQIGFLFLVNLLFLSCKRTDVLDEETFIKIYVDVIIYKDTASSAIYSNKSVLKNILDAHGVTMDEYEQTIDYYSQDLERWESFFSKAVSYLESKRKLEQK